MRMISFVCVIFCLSALMASGDQPQDMAAVLNFKMNSLDGKPVELKEYQGDVVLMVNVASECGLTPQYERLEKLYQRYHGQGLEVLGFPANEFGGQEPGSNTEIKAFCQKNYGVTFPMFAKVVVQGDGICPLYKFLTSAETNGTFAGPIKWNFEKFLVGRSGKVVARFEPNVEPDAPEVIAAIERELAQK